MVQSLVEFEPFAAVIVDFQWRRHLKLFLQAHQLKRNCKFGETADGGISAGSLSLQG